MADIAEHKRMVEVGDAELDAIERTAVELANLAAAEIVTTLGSLLSVRYKGDPQGEMAWRDPVSEVDRHVEVLIRARLAERFPDHDIIGEEMDERPGRDHDFVWAIDPIDGTTNFVNGFPLFAASIGVLFRGRPVVGAVWCSTSHKLTAGVYHARDGGGLCFDHAPVTHAANPNVRRGLGGLSSSAAGSFVVAPWDVRVTGSAAIECAFVAAGLLRAARFERPNLWDVAGGLVLVRSTGGEVWQRSGEGWVPMQRFEMSPRETPDLRLWHRALIIGPAAEAARLSELSAA
jgi:myo-inositol-1(or 4)-monophosphatase